MLPLKVDTWRLCASDKDVVKGNVNQLNDVADSTHDEETDTDGLAELQELELVGLGAPSHELNTFLSELGGNLEDLLDLVGHCG